MALVPSYDPTLDRQNMAIQSSLLQQLGNQLRRDVQTVQTNRQLKGFTEGLQNVNPDSEQFGQQIVGLMGQYPMALQTPLAQSAVSQLGAQHRYWQQEQLRESNSWRSAGQGVFYNSSTGDTKIEPSLRPPVRPVQIGRNTVALQDPTTGDVTKVEEFGLTMPTTTDPVALEEERQKNRIEMEKLRQQGRATIDPIAKAKLTGLNTRLNGANSLLMKKQGELAGLQAQWRQTEDEAEKLRIGMEVNNAIDQVRKYNEVIKGITSEVDQIAASLRPSTPSIGPAVLAPEAEESDTLIPPELTEPATKKFRYVPGQGIVPR